MKAFRLHEPTDIAEAVAILHRYGTRARPLAAGTDLVAGMMRDTLAGKGMPYPDHLVDLTTIRGLARVQIDTDRAVIGATTTLSEIAASPLLDSRWPLLTAAARSVASPEIRTIATLGGNIHQRPRCWFFRSRHFDCLKKGGDVCYAVEGDNRFNAIVRGSLCYIVHPSDVATALMALGAHGRVAGPLGERVIPFDEYFVSPADDLLRETVLEPDEILVDVVVPRPSNRARMVWRKINDKPDPENWDFALVSVAIVGELEDSIWRDGRIVLGGVAPVPYRFTAAEEILSGRDVREVGRDAAKAIHRVARPMRDNAYKVDIAEAVVYEALQAILSPDGR